jgi:hypothetical protein
MDRHSTVSLGEDLLVGKQCRAIDAATHILRQVVERKLDESDVYVVAASAPVFSDVSHPRDIDGDAELFIEFAAAAMLRTPIR